MLRKKTRWAIQHLVIHIGMERPAKNSLLILLRRKSTSPPFSTPVIAERSSIKEEQQRLWI